MSEKTNIAFVVLGLAAVLGGLAYVKKNGGVGNLATSAGVAAGGAVVDAGVGTVLGIGDAIGLPRTNADLCAQYQAAGDWWNASFYCPAGTFLSSIFSTSGSAGTDGSGSGSSAGSTSGGSASIASQPPVYSDTASAGFGGL